MITIRRAAERGHADHGWLDSHHSFSFADYHDPNGMGFRSLRVLNDDRVAPGRGFGVHPHRDMEIVTIVFEGSLQHQDDMENTKLLRAGEVQRMTAGTGVVHSEYNPSEKDGLTPGYEQKLFPPDKGLQLVASREGRDGSLRIHQDAKVYRAGLAKGEPPSRDVASGRHAWVQLARGGGR